MNMNIAQIEQIILKIKKYQDLKSFKDFASLSTIFYPIFVLLFLITVFILKKTFHHFEKNLIKDNPSIQRVLINSTKTPLKIILVSSFFYISYCMLIKDNLSIMDKNLINNLYYTGIILSFFYIIFNFFTELKIIYIMPKDSKEISKYINHLAIAFGQMLTPFIAFMTTIKTLDFSTHLEKIFNYLSGITFIISITWSIIHVTGVLESIILQKYDLTLKSNIKTRSVHTQVKVIRKIIIALVFIFSISSVLMLFDSFRQIGTGILASAGIVGLVVGAAAQKTIANLFAGFQIALTQPICIDDVLVVEGEWGRVEEITLTYVVIALWDQRRLVLPISYFIEKPFQNWTKHSSEIIGSVFLYLDYGISLDIIETEVKALCHGNPNWDGRTANARITNTTPQCVEIRILVSAQDAGNCFELRCYIRQKMLEFIQKNYEGYLPKLRFEADALKKS